MAWYWQFLKRYGFVGFVLTVLVGVFVAMLVLLAVLGPARYNDVWMWATLPGDLAVAARQPWTIFTYWFAGHPLNFWMFLIDMLVFYSFGHILNSLIGDRRMQVVVLLGAAVSALVAVGLSNLSPLVHLTPSTRLWGMGAINATVIAAAVTLVPHYSVRVLFWELPLLFVGLFVLLASILAMGHVVTLEGNAEIAGAGVGVLIVKLLRQGWDVTNWFRGAANRPAAQPVRRPEPVVSNPRPVVRTIHTKQQQQQPASAPAPMSEDEELDYLLDKINDVGYEGLTKAEKERLDYLSGK